MPLVRIVIPTYNRATLLAEAIEKVLLQSLSDFEVIVVDDGSTDDTEVILQQFSAKDSRIRYLKQLNSGPANARNRALKEPGQYSYIAFLDSDDLWHPRHLEESVTVLQRESKVGLVFSRVETINVSGHLTTEGIQARERRVSTFLRYATPSCIRGVSLIDASICFRAILRSEFGPHLSTAVVRREAVLRSQCFNPDLVPVEDVEFFLYLAAHHCSFAFVDSVQACVRYYGDNLTGAQDLSSLTTLRRQRSVLQYTKMKLELCSLHEDSKFVSKEIARTAYLIAQCYAEQGDLSSARHAYFDAILHQFSYKALKGFICSLLPNAIYYFLRKQRDILCSTFFLD
jgi:glycosyltransferase involved in cell wall biosynthesis